jgi:hypothetical protein
MSKSPEIQKFLDELAKDLLGGTVKEANDAHICLFCGGPATEFYDEISKKEYTLSGQCQKCQDNFFEE